MQEYKTSILFTRPIDQRLVERAYSCSIKIVAIPFIRVSPLSPEQILRSVSPVPKESCTVIFTSANAVHAVAAVAPDTSHWRIYCMSRGTLKAVHSHLPGANVVEVADNAVDLAKAVLADKEVKQAHFFAGNLHLKQLPDMLTNAGVAVNTYEVYHTALTPEVIAGHFDGIAFFSPSAVDSFLSVNEMGKDATLFAMGQTTAARLQSFSNEVIIARSPDPSVLVEQIIEHYNRKHNKIRN